MSTRAWFDGDGLFSNDKDWIGGAPHPGHTLTINRGEVEVENQNLLSYDIELGSTQVTNPYQTPVLYAFNSEITGLRVVDENTIPNKFGGFPTKYAQLDIAGTVTLVGGNGFGSDPLSSGDGGKPADVTVSLTQGSVLKNEDGLTGRAGEMTIQAAGSNPGVFQNDGLIQIDDSTQLTVNAALTGRGTIEIGYNPTPTYLPSGFVNLNGPVGSSDTVDMRGGTLAIGEPMKFLATVNVAPVTPFDVAWTTVQLDAKADKASFGNDLLKIYEGQNLVGSVHLDPAKGLGVVVSDLAPSDYPDGPPNTIPDGNTYVYFSSTGFSDVGSHVSAIPSIQSPSNVPF